MISQELSKFGPFFKICVITFSLFRHEASQWGCWCTDKSWLWLNCTKCKILVFCNFLTIFSKTVWKLVFIFCVYSFLLMIDSIDNLSTDGFDWIIQKVIFKVGNVRFGPFSHNYQYYSVVTKCCPLLLHHVAYLVWNESWPKIWKVWSYSKSHLQCQKWDLDLSVYPIKFDIGWHWKVKLR